MNRRKRLGDEPRTIPGSWLASKERDPSDPPSWGLASDSEGSHQVAYFTGGEARLTRFNDDTKPVAGTGDIVWAFPDPDQRRWWRLRLTVSVPNSALLFTELQHLVVDVTLLGMTARSSKHDDTMAVLTIDGFVHQSHNTLLLRQKVDRMVTAIAGAAATHKENARHGR